MMNINEVQKRIKQRPPFQMIEKVLEIRGGEYAKGIKNVSINEPYFMGHFPDAPIMPGVLIVEACAQLCSVTIKCDEFKFVKPVLPGDTLTIEVTKDGGGAGLVKFDCKAFVDGEIRAKGKLAFCAVDKANIYG